MKATLRVATLLCAALAMLCAALAVLCASAVAQTLPALQSQVDAALRAPTLAGAHVGILAVDAADGRVLYARNADDDFVPASTLKLIVGSAALARLGRAFTFRTDLATTGSIADGVLTGNLYLRGGGDAQLSRADLDAAAASLAAAGVRRLCCGIIADSSRYAAPRYPSGWEVDDLPYDYAAVPSALSLELNVAHVRVVPGALAGAPTMLRVDPSGDAVEIQNASVTGAAASADTTDVARPWNRSGIIQIIGSYPTGAPPSDDLEPAVVDPVDFSMHLFRQALAAKAIAFGDLSGVDRTPAGATVLWTHRSKPLSALLRDFWQPSINLFGEQLLLELGADAQSHAAQGERGDTRMQGLQAERAWLRSINVDPHAVTLADGSGLSSYDRVTPRVLTDVLQAGWQGRYRALLLSSLPEAGMSGTLRSRFTRAPLRAAVFAKTGSANHVRTLAGYARTPAGRWITFAIMINDWMDDSPQSEQAIDAARAAILTALLHR